MLFPLSGIYQEEMRHERRTEEQEGPRSVAKEVEGEPQSRWVEEAVGLRLHRQLGEKQVVEGRIHLLEERRGERRWRVRGYWMSVRSCSGIHIYMCICIYGMAILRRSSHPGSGRGKTTRRIRSRSHHKRELSLRDLILGQLEPDGEALRKRRSGKECQGDLHSV